MSNPVLWKVLLIQPTLVVGDVSDRAYQVARFVSVYRRQKSCEVGITLESLFGRPHLGGQHNQFCLQSWNSLLFL